MAELLKYSFLHLYTGIPEMQTPEREYTIKGFFGFFLYITSIAGLAPLKIECVKRGWRLTVSKTVNVYGKLFVLLLCIVAALALIMTYQLRPRPFHLQTTSDRILAVLTLTIALPASLVASFTGMERMSNLINYLAKIDKINNVLNQFHKQATNNEWKISLFTASLLILGNFTVFTEYGLFVNRVMNDNYEVTWHCMYIFYYILVEYIQLVSIQFFLTTFSILNSFKLCNNCLRSIYTNLDGIYMIEKPIMTLAGAIHRIRFQYFALSDVMASLNESHGLMLIQLLMVFLINLTVTPYKILNTLFNVTSVDYYSVGLQFFWLALHISNLLIVIDPCQQTHNEMNKTKRLISKLMRRTSRSEEALSSELQSFYTNLMMQDVTYTPLGMFTIDRTLIMPMLGTISTYLVIVLTL